MEFLSSRNGQHGLWKPAALASLTVLSLTLSACQGGRWSSDLAMGSDPRIGPSLAQRMHDAPDDQALQVIVTFHGNQALSAEQIESLDNLGLNGIYMRALPIAGVLATPEQVRQMAALPGVRSIYHNDPLEYHNDGGGRIIGVDRLRQDPHLLAANGGLPFDGSGVTIMINDSGIDATHEDLKCELVAGPDGPACSPDGHVIQNVLANTNLAAHNADIESVGCEPTRIDTVVTDPQQITPPEQACHRGLLPITAIENFPNSDPVSGHGTHVAGTAGGSGAMSAGQYAGVAPGAKLVGYGSGAVILVLDVLGGLDYAAANRDTLGIRVINNSWGTSPGPGQEFDPDNPVNVATQILAEDLGIIVVFAAGNSGPGEASIGGIYPRAPWVIVAASGTKSGRLSDFSSRGAVLFSGTYFDEARGIEYQLSERPTVTAPGSNIVSTRSSVGDPVPTTEIDPAHEPFYTIKSGTSMAAPHVTGTVALMLQANPALQWREVKRILELTATNIADLADWEGGAGYLNAHAAVAMAAGLRDDFGATNRLHRRFNAFADMTVASKQTYNVEYSLMNADVAGVRNISNFAEFEVGPNVTLVIANGNVPDGSGQVMRIALQDPSGVLHNPGVPIPGGATSGYRTISAPGMEGTWRALVRGSCGLSGTVSVSWCSEQVPTNGIGTPTDVQIEVRQIATRAIHGLADVGAHPQRGFIEAAVTMHLADGRRGGFEPSAALQRIELAEYLSLNPGLRQVLPLDRVPSFADVDPEQQAFAEAAAAPGSMLLDPNPETARPVIELASTRFEPAALINRAQLAYSLGQALGQEATASAFAEAVQYDNDGVLIPVVDIDTVPADLHGYIQYALSAGLIAPDIIDGQAYFRPDQAVRRGEYAVAAVRASEAYFARCPDGVDERCQ